MPRRLFTLRRSATGVARKSWTRNVFLYSLSTYIGTPPGSFSDRDENKPYRSQRLVPLPQGRRNADKHNLPQHGARSTNPEFLKAELPTT